MFKVIILDYEVPHWRATEDNVFGKNILPGYRRSGGIRDSGENAADSRTPDRDR